MNAGDFKRKLTAVFSADVVGYSRLMGEDEAGTVKTLEDYKQVMSSLIKQHRGRVVDSPGDNLLAEFASVVDAVQCGVAVQKELQARNADLPENRRMQFRIGINLGDVIEEGNRIYGDGVNIAARLESLADPGGICVSKTAFDHIETKLPLGYEYLGEKEVKNIAKPVGAYKVLMDPRVTVAGAKEKQPLIPLWSRKGVLAGAAAVLVVVIGLAVWNFYLRHPPIEPASVDKMAFPLPDRPSIAVLPFANMSGDPKEEYFSDGLTEQIITTLSRYPRLFVIARQSSFYYKGKPVKVQQVAEELGVQYVLEGGVQKSGDRVRITAQLIDAITGRHVWSERYDREIKDIFALQDEITLNVMNGMSAELTEGEQARRWTQGVTNLKALEKHYQAQGYFCRHTKENYDKARPLFEEAIALDHNFVWPYVYLGYLYIGSVSRGWSEDPAKSLKMAFELGQKALAIDDSHDGAHSLMALNFIVKRQYGKALSEAERAIALNPNASDAYMILANVLGILGKWEESLFNAKKSLRLSPFPGAAPFKTLALAYFMKGQYDESIETWNKALKVSPNFLEAHVYLAACYSSMGREEEARAAAEKVLGIEPKFSIESFAKRLYFRNEADKERVVAALGKAGLPDKPPLPLPDKPSIAVLPFVNMSDDPQQEYFSDGLAEEIITALSKTPKLLVIARNSSFVYKGNPVNVQQVSRELGVKYVLEGSVRRSGDQLRITAQLIDATTGNHLWAERYERSLGQIFSLQDDITLAIVRAMRVTLTEGEEANLMGKGTTNLDAYLKALEANEQFFRMNREGSIKAKQFAGEAIALDPKYASPYAIMANAHMLDLWFGFGKSPQESMKLASEAAHKALSLDNSDPSIYVTFCNLYIMQRQYDQAIAWAERAVELCPNGARANYSLGTALVFACRFSEAVRALEFAIRLDPFPSGRNFSMLGSAYRELGRYEEAIEMYKKGLQVEPGDVFTHLGVIVAYIKTGREEEARNQAAEVMKLHPKFSLEDYGKIFHLKDQSIADDYIASLRKAGLK